MKKMIFMMLIFVGAALAQSRIYNPVNSGDVKRAGGVLVDGSNFNDYPDALTVLTAGVQQVIGDYQFKYIEPLSGFAHYTNATTVLYGGYGHWKFADIDTPNRFYIADSTNAAPPLTGWYEDMFGAEPMPVVSYTLPSSNFRAVIGAVSSNDIYGAVSDAAQINSRVIPCDEYTITYTSPATNVNGTIYVLGQTSSWMAETGIVEITCSEYLVDVFGEIIEAETLNPMVPEMPVYTTKTRTSNTSIVFTAWCGVGGNGNYFAYITNAVPVMYDLAGMLPNSITNDGAGIITRCDTLPDSGLDVSSDPRQAVNADSMKAYFDSRKTEIANAAWDRTPSGKAVPDSRFVTIDEPLVQHGSMAWLQSGDYYVMSYTGGDYSITTEGSAWWLGPAGAKAFGVTSTNKVLNIMLFDVTDDVATLDISTNGVVGVPVIQGTGDLLNPQWLQCPSHTMTDMGTYWRGQCDASPGKMFFRAVSPGGEQRVISKYPAILEQGIDDGDGNLLTNMIFNINGTNIQFYGRILP